MKYELFNKLATEVAEVFGVNEEDIFKKSKERTGVDARYLLYYLCKVNKMKLTYIQNYMNDRGYSIPHSTIHHGIKDISKKVDEDVDYQVVIDRINRLCTI